jgi:predicted Na+-dependent transporter
MQFPNLNAVQRVVVTVVVPSLLAIVVYSWFAVNEEKTWLMSFANFVLNAIQVFALIFYIPNLISLRQQRRRIIQEGK